MQSFSRFSLYQHCIVSIVLLVCCFSFAYGQQDLEIKKEEYTVKYADFLYNESRRLVRSYSDSAILLGKKIHVISKAIDYSVGIAKGKEATARAYMFIKPDSLSFSKAHDAFNYAKSIGADSVLLETINLLGAGYYRSKEIHKTFEYNRMGLSYAKEYGNWQKQFLFTSNAASIMADLNDYEKAMDYFKETLIILEKHPDSVSYQSMYFYMSKINLQADSVQKALFNLNNSKKYVSTHSDLSSQLKLLILEAAILLELHQMEKAGQVLEQAEKLEKESQDHRALADLKLVQAKLNLELQELEIAENKALGGILLADISNYVRTKQLLLEALYHIKSQQNNFKEANQILRSTMALKDSINFDDNQNKLKIAIAENNSINEQEILKLELQRANTFQKNTALTALLIILSLLSILYLVKRNERSLKNLNMQLKEKTIRLDEANNSKNKLFSIIAHDFKGPITNLKTLIDLLISKDLSQEKFAIIIPKLKNRVANVLFSLNNLLYWGSGQLEGNAIELTNLKITEKVKDALDLLYDSIDEKQIEIVNALSSKTMVVADNNHIDIVFRNLLSNAIKFTPKNGKIYIASQENEDSWLISIRDTGAGMSKSIQDMIFNQHKRVTTYGTNNEKGTGLGLSLCIDMIIKNKGSIWVESAPNNGTTLKFSLPKA